MCQLREFAIGWLVRVVGARQEVGFIDHQEVCGVHVHPTLDLAVTENVKWQSTTRQGEVIEVELLEQFGAPLGLQLIGDDDTDAPSRDVDEELSHHETGLDRLAHPYLVG